MADVTLLPCPNPWCPSAPKVISIGTTKYPALFPVCTICKAQPRGTWSTEEAAIVAWNRRADATERAAVLTAHRACCGTEHDPANGKLHGCCVVCGIPWPCEYAGDSPEQMRRRCFHDFRRLIQACIEEIDEDDACVLQTFGRFVDQHGIPGLGTGTCDCGNDDCPYKTANVPCDCGRSDCSDPRAASPQQAQESGK